MLVALRRQRGADDFLAGVDHFMKLYDGVHGTVCYAVVG